MCFLVRGFGAITIACCLLPAPFSATLPRTLPNEQAALALLREKGSAAQCNPEDAGWLISHSWWDAARELVISSHSHADSKCRTSLETVVRRHVSDMKLEADALLLSLAPKDDAKVGVVHEEKATVTDCCFNFSANGEHSQLRKRYTLDLPFFKEVDPKRWSWKIAAAGRMTVEIAKKVPMKWPRLLLGKEKPGNMAVWESMYQRWGDELDSFDRLKAVEKRSQGKVDKKKSKEELDSEDEQAHEDGNRRCHDSPSSPFYRNRNTLQLCEAYWPPTMKGKRGTQTPWLVLFYSPKKLNCRERDKKCNDIYDKWRTLERKVPEISTAKLGLVDCDAQSDFCSKQKVGHMPFVRRYKDGKRKPYYDEWDIDAVMKFVLS